MECLSHEPQIENRKAKGMRHTEFHHASEMRPACCAQAAASHADMPPNRIEQMLPILSEGCVHWRPPKYVAFLEPARSQPASHAEIHATPLMRGQACYTQRWPEQHCHHSQDAAAEKSETACHQPLNVSPARNVSHRQAIPSRPSRPPDDGQPPILGYVGMSESIGKCLSEKRNAMCKENMMEEIHTLPHDMRMSPARKLSIASWDECNESTTTTHRFIDSFIRAIKDYYYRLLRRNSSSERMPKCRRLRSVLPPA